MNAALAAAPLAGQGAAMLASAYGGDPNTALQGYGGAVGLTAAVSAAEIARQASYAAGVARNPGREQPAPSGVRLAGAVAGVAGGALYGTGAGLNRPDLQGIGATVQALGVATVEASSQPVHTPRPADDGGPVLPRYNQDVARYAAEGQQRSSAAPSESQAAVASVTGRQTQAPQGRRR